MLSSIGRAAIRRLISAPVTTSSNRIVVSSLSADSLRSGHLFVRGYATAGKPKAKSTATTKSAAKPAATKGRTKTTTKAKATKATKTTKATASKSKSTKSKTAVKAKPKAKATAKAKAKKRPLSPEKKSLIERKELKKAALFELQKRLAETPWTVFVSESSKGTPGGPGVIRDKMIAYSQEYKNLPASRLQRLQATAEQNKATNAAEYKAWVESYTPREIHAANHARKVLKKKHNYPPKAGVKLIVDERLPKQPVTPYSLYTKDRWASGDFANKSIAESSKQLSAEWKNMSEADRRPFNELYKISAAQYAKDVSEVLHRKVRFATVPGP
ncbi:hypothetical protein F5B19DRAFT_438445 [Rostrohypoxylon terebratum]|nr:hypothetical protein F5B19DRAFT_438445 [Rostrohypoxylon terebratum]